jgi:gas vesicle protein
MGKISDAMQNVVDEVRSSAETRGAALREISEETQYLMKDTHNVLKEIHRTNQARAKSLRDRLSSERKAGVKDTRELMQDVKKFIEGTRVRVSEMRSGTHNHIDQLHLERRDVAKALREKLLSERKKIFSEREAIAKAAQEFMANVTSDLREAHRIWTEEGKEKAMPETVAREVEEIERERGGQKQKILEVVARHPDGIKLIDMGNELGVDWRTLIGPIKSLMDKDKVEKIDTMYYPQ